jgi:hypothetical protein
MKTGWRYLAFSTLFLGASCVHALRTPPEGSVTSDFLALALTYGVVLASLGGIWGAMALIRRADGEMDWGEAAVPARAGTATDVRGAHLPV